MPIGPFGEIIGTTGTLECLGEGASSGYKSKVIAPRNPKLLKGEKPDLKVGLPLYISNDLPQVANISALSLELHGTFSP